MKPLCSALIVALAWGTSLAQPFRWQHPAPTGNNLNDAVILPSGAWVLAGDGGTVVRSTDRGASWTFFQPETAYSDIYETMFAAENAGYLCTTNGSIMKSTDGGLSWRYLTSGTTSSLWYLDFLNPDTGLAVGAASTLLRTTDGGGVWTPVGLSTSALLSKVHWVNAAIAYIGSSSATLGRLLRSTDGGLSWANVPGYTGGGTTRGIFFRGPDTGWVTNSSYQIFRTTDGGASFPQQASLGTGTLYEVKFADADRGAAAGANGEVFVTTNGGGVWTPSDIGYNSNVFGLSVEGVPGRKAVPALLAGGVGGAIAGSTDWGESWTPHSSALVRQDLREVQFLDDNLGYAVGGSSTSDDSLGFIMKTTDGGSTWGLLPFNPKHRIYGTFWLDAATGYVTSIGPTGIWKTTDGGASFAQLVLPVGVPTSIWYRVRFLNHQTGYVAGSAGYLCKTTDGGMSWFQQTSGHGASAIYDIFLIDDQTAVTTGGSGRVYKTVNGGAFWYSIGIGGTTTVYSSWWHNADTGFVSGSGGVLRMTTNGGGAWTPLTINTTATLYRIHFTDLHNGWVCGSLGVLFRTTDGGATWNRATRIVSSGKTLYDLDVRPRGIHVVGTDATIIYGDLAPTGAGDPPDPLPVGVTLSQNYPNPFNAASVLEFRLPQAAHVRLAVYDLLGREAAVLVDERKEPGVHRAVLASHKLASGVYLCRLECGGAALVRKMVLLR
ncbi:MAG: YCF48-related protein [Bacteroidota bacterium]